MASGEENTKSLNEFFYTWRIENLHLLRQNWRKKITTEEKLKSPTFEVGFVHKHSYSLLLYPEGTIGNEDCISYFLAREDEVSSNIKLFETELYLIAFDGSKVGPECSSGFLKMKNIGIIGCKRFMRWETLMKEKSYYFPDEILTVGCRIWREVKQDPKGNKPSIVKVCSDQTFVRTQIKKEVIAKQMVIDSIAPKGQKIGEIKSLLQDFPTATFFASFNKISGEESVIVDIEIKKDDRIKTAIFKFMLMDEKRKRTFWMNTFSWNDFTEFVSIVLSSQFSRNSEYYAPAEMFVEKFLFLACEFSFTTGLVVQRKEKADYGANLNHLMPVYFPCYPPSYKKPAPCPNLKDSLMIMYQDKLFHDVKIQNGPLNVTAHKLILCSRSSKFETLLRDLAEASLQVLQVEDDMDTLEKVVYFLYTDDIVDINWKIATTLYSAAMKYKIGLLKHKCCNFIEANFDKSNVVEILLLAKEHNDAEMMDLVRNFVMENRTEVYLSDDWINFSKSHSLLAVEIMLPKFQSK